MQDYSKGTVRLYFANEKKIAFKNQRILSMTAWLRTLPLKGIGPKLVFLKLLQH